MTYDEATKICLAGKPIHHPGMSRGWKIMAATEGDALFCINPHTGSNYQFTPKSDDIARNDWKCFDE